MSNTVYDVEGQPVELDGDNCVYVIGPISKFDPETHPDNPWNIKAFENVRSAIENRFHSRVSIPQDFIPDDIPYEDMMDMSFAHLKQQDAVVRLSDWANSAGATRETDLCYQIGMTLIDEDEIFA